MKTALRLGALGFAALFAAGCSGSGGGVLANPPGDITLTNTTTGETITSSLDKPYIIPAGALNFSVDLLESHYAGPYTFPIVYTTNVATALNGGNKYPYIFSTPCFSIAQHAKYTTQKVTLTFTGAGGSSGQYNYPTGQYVDGTTPIPCHSGELEQVLIGDTRGHSLNFFYEEE